jgi:hypothetical protein
MSLKISCPQPKRRYPGNLGEHNLKQALDLLFLIKGKTYKNTSPEFIIPTADEFLTYCKYVSEDLFFIQNQGRRLHRSISSEKLNHAQYIEFFESIVQTKTITVYDRLSMSVSIVFYALFLYFYTGIFMKLSIGFGEKLVDSDDSVQTFKVLFLNSIYWFCIHALPSLEKYKKEIVYACFEIYDTNINPLVTNMGETGSPRSYYKTEQQFSTIFDKIVVEPGMFDNMLKKNTVTALIR